MKKSEIQLYWKEQRDASYRSDSTSHNLSAIPKHVDEPYVEHQGSTVKSKTAYMMKCMPCGNRSFK